MGNDFAPGVTALAIARSRLGLPQKGRIVLYAGRFAPEHPLDLLIDAAPAIMDRIRLVHFVLIGDGIMRRRLEGLARARSLDAAIIFAGDVPQPLVNDFVVASDLGLSISSCFGCEAHAFSPEEIWPFLNVGRAVVAASDLFDARRFIQEHNIGCSAEITGRRSQDIDNLVLSMSSMLGDSQSLVRRGENARRLGRAMAADRSVFGLLKASVRRAAAF